MSLPTFQEIHIENTNSCGYKCIMCPRESQTRRIGYMSLSDLRLVLERIGTFEGVFHLHGFGEPLLDRHLPQKVAMIREHSPSSRSMIFSTLGVRVKENLFNELLEAGLSAVVVSLYGFNPIDYKNIHGYDGFELVKKNLLLLAQARQLHPGRLKSIIKIPSQNIRSTLPIGEPPERAEFCKWAEGLGFEIGHWGYVHNYSDGRHYNLPETEQMCPVIDGKRRNILNITWDLDVIPCCYDYNATIPFGNLRQQTMEEIFSSPEYLSFVLAHKSGDLSAYPICMNCEKRDYS